MISKTNRVVIGVASLALAGVLVATAYAVHVGPFDSRDLGPVIATVNGRPIYLSEARSRVQGLSSVHGNITEALGSDAWDKVLESLVDDKIILEEAERRGITVSDQEIAAALARAEGMFQSLSAFQEWLESEQIDVAELERRIGLQMLASRVYLAVTAGVTVSAEEMRAYYRSHRSEYEGTDGTTPPFLEVRASIKQDLEKTAKDHAYAAWLEDRRQAAKVVVVLDDWWRRLT